MSFSSSTSLTQNNDFEVPKTPDTEKNNYDSFIAACANDGIYISKIESMKTPEQEEDIKISTEDIEKVLHFSFKKIENYFDVRAYTQDEAKTLFMHKIKIVKKINSTKENNLWYAKKVANVQDAILEYYAQEVLRMLIPVQPKTRIAINKEKNEIHILSQAVKGFSPFKTIKRLLNNEEELLSYQHWGDLTLACLVLNEIDLKDGNIGYNENKDIIKLDGEWCFARLRYTNMDAAYQITANDFEKLPSIDDYQAFHWLGSRKSGEKISKPVFSEKFIAHKKIRREVNQGTLKFLILTPELIKDFSMQCAQFKDVEPFFNELIARIDNLRQIAIRNEGFKNFVTSKNANQSFNDYTGYLKQFRTTKHYTLPINEKSLNNQMQLLKASCLLANIKLPIKNSISPNNISQAQHNELMKIIKEYLDKKIYYLECTKDKEEFFSPHYRNIPQAEKLKTLAESFQKNCVEEKNITQLKKIIKEHLEKYGKFSSLFPRRMSFGNCLKEMEEKLDTYECAKKNLFSYKS